ncbi:MAG: hypothetical protein KDK36_05520, partial [Leptospiraceae bacterium]|nr:hypothetical protein [Leptospiraceae bacterium]
MLLKFYIYILIIGILNCKGNFNNGNTNSLNPSQLIPFALMGGAASSSSSNSDNSNLIVTDSNGSPLGNHIISFQPTGQVVTSDSNGNISINLPPGIYSATVKDTNGNIIGTYEVTVAENGYTQYLITAGNIGLITNTGAVVYYGVNPSTSAQDSPLISSEGTLLGNNNQPLQNYTIIPQPDLGEIRTGSNGEFSTNLPQGNYNFLVKDPYGNLIGNFSGSVSQEGVSNLSINSGNFSINYGGSSASPQNSISGNIKNTKGQNIYGGSITVQPGNEVINIDYSGNFTSNLSPGTYTFTTKDRLGSVIGTYTALIGEGSVSLMAINSGNIHVTMGGISATPYISASLSNYSGQHLAGYTITSQSGSNSWVTDENGNFSGNLPSGTHTLNVKDPSGNSTGTISLTINEYGNPQASITTGNFIVNTGGLSYYPLELTTITDLQGNPLSNYLVYTQGGTDTATNENGNYSTVLRPGSYYVEIYETSSSYESTGGYNLTID